MSQVSTGAPVKQQQQQTTTPKATSPSQLRRSFTTSRYLVRTTKKNITKTCRVGICDGWDDWICIVRYRPIY